MSQARELAEFATAYGGGNYGMRNRILNGSMVLDQRNAGASVTLGAGGTYTLDRYRCYSEAASKLSIQQVADAPTGFVNSMKATSLSSYSVGTNELFGIFQNIEGFNTADLGFGASGASTVTLSFWVKSSLTGTFGGSLNNDGYARAYPFTYTVSSANTWEQKTITIVGDTSGTWLTNNGIGISVFLGLGAGSGRSGTAGAWTGTGLVFSATGATSVVGTNGATFYLTGVQLEAGSVATPFERRPYGAELVLCQRYYETSYPLGFSAGHNFGQQYPFSTSKPVAINFIASDDTTVSQTVRFVVQKRASPTVVIYSASDGTTGVTWTYKGTGGTNINLAASVTYTSQDLWNINQLLGAVNQANESYFHFTASAEL
jgi:hypothetical protein